MQPWLSMEGGLPTDVDLGLSGKVALVTGGARGIGGAISQTLAAAGARVAVHFYQGAREAERLAETLPGSQTYAVDLSSETGPGDLVERVTADFGKVNVLVNNAAVLIGARMDTTTLLDWERTIRLNLTVPFLLAQLVLPSMMSEGGGSIVNIASIAGVNGGNAGPAYGASKGGLISLTKYMARECGRFGVRVNAVAPTLTDTEMIRQPAMQEAVQRQLTANPLGRLAEPSEIAGAVLFLCSSLATYINGECVAVWGGP